MENLGELDPVARARQLRHTLVRGADGKHYKVLTFRLYDFAVAPEFATHETSVEAVSERGTRRALVQPLLKRFFSEQEALDFHRELLERFDDFLGLKPAPKPGAAGH